MIPPIYDSESLHDRAFRRAVDLTSPGSFFASTKPEMNLPPTVVREWFGEAGRDIDLATCERASIALVGAGRELVAADLREERMRDLGASRREKIGSRDSVDLALNSIARSALRLSEALSFIRHEVVYRRSRGAGWPDLERLHEHLHHAFAGGEPGDLQRSTPTSQSEQWTSVDVARAPTWLERGLDRLISQVQIETTIQMLSHADPRSRLSSRPRSRMRENFIRKSAEVWSNSTATKPTIASTDDTRHGRLSSFQIFHSLLCGHVAGSLAPTMLFGLEPIFGCQRDAFRAYLQRLGLLTLPSPTTLRRIVNQVSNSTPFVDG